MLVVYRLNVCKVLSCARESSSQHTGTGVGLPVCDWHSLLHSPSMLYFASTLKQYRNSEYNPCGKFKAERARTWSSCAAHITRVTSTVREALLQQYLAGNKCCRAGERISEPDCQGEEGRAGNNRQSKKIYKMKNNSNSDDPVNLV